MSSGCAGIRQAEDGCTCDRWRRRLVSRTHSYSRARARKEERERSSGGWLGVPRSFTCNSTYLPWVQHLVSFKRDWRHDNHGVIVTTLSVQAQQYPRLEPANSSYATAVEQTTKNRWRAKVNIGQDIVGLCRQHNDRTEKPTLPRRYFERLNRKQFCGANNPHNPTLTILSLDYSYKFLQKVRGNK